MVRFVYVEYQRITGPLTVRKMLVPLISISLSVILTGLIAQIELLERFCMPRKLQKTL